MIVQIAAKILFDILTYGIFIYSVVLLLSYVLIGLYSIGETQKHLRKNAFTDFRVLAASIHAPTVSILAPAYNEGLNIVENVRSLLSIYYTNLEVIIINDGSKDDSLAKLIEAYDLEKIDFFIQQQIDTKEVRGVYKSRNSIYHKLIVVDKVNGGKADALNVGINISSNDYLVCIDVDCILEQDALLKMIKPFLEQTDKRVIASGGVVRIANSCTIEEGRLVKIKLADDYLPQIQILEYIRAFILGRMAWTRLNGLMLISGAFGAFDKEIAIQCGGYNPNTVGEDMELVVRMRRLMEERGEEYVVTYIPDPLCWTEAPASFQILGRQRNRWIRGTFETLYFHRIMFFNPRYHLLGMLSYPYWFFFELCAPAIEFFGFICFLIFALLGMMDWGFFLTYFFFIIFFSYLYSCFAILMEVVTFNQYRRRIDILRLMLTGLTEPFYYHPFVVWSAIKGLFDLFKKEKSWGEMTRQGFAKKTEAARVSISTIPQNTPVPQTKTVPEIPKKNHAASLLERKIVPAISKTVLFISRSFTEYSSLVFVLLILLLFARILELALDYSQHGTPAFFWKVVLYGFAKDFSFFLKIIAPAFLVFSILFLLQQKIAKTLFIIGAIVLVLIQLSLSQYFIKTLVPLGADLWVYSIADIRQTVGASGGVPISLILILIVLVALSIGAFIYFPPRIKIRGLASFLLFIFFIFVSGSGIANATDTWLPGQEYSNNLSINKADYFFSKSYQYFFPPAVETDIYSDAYSGDYALGVTQNDSTVFRYIDEKNYPFLHSVDTSVDVLSPFFNHKQTPPNIVILLVEGLGRAFTNDGAYLGNFTPFIDSLAGKSLYWQNFLSEGGRTFAVLPSLLGSLPFTKNGFNELANRMPPHLSLLNVLEHNGYASSFYYGGESHFDNMDMFLKKNTIGFINDEKEFPPGYTKMPSQNGFTWGYGDKELFRHYMELTQKSQASGKPLVNIILTVSTHDPFKINEQVKYLQKFEDRMTELGLTEEVKKQRRNYQYQFASILYMDDAINHFIQEYSKRPDFANTVFLITGDHRMPEIPMNNKIDRYHVPLIIYSPLLKRTARFTSISTHFDITPSLLAWLKKSYKIKTPSVASWMGTGLDTTRGFRNIHAYPIMQTKNDLVDFIKGGFMLSNNNLFRIGPNMELTPEQNQDKQNELTAAFNAFLAKNRQIQESLKIVPDSILLKFRPH